MAIATPLSTSGRFIVDTNGKRIRLAGVNWYGASEDMGVPAGLDRIDRGTLAGLIAAQGFNSVRLPFSVWMTEQTAPVPQQVPDRQPRSVREERRSRSTTPASRRSPIRA